MNPVAPFGSAIVGDVEDLQGQTRIKVQHARAVVDNHVRSVGIRPARRQFVDERARGHRTGRGISARRRPAAWKAFRKIVPVASTADEPGAKLVPTVTAAFLRDTLATSFYGELPPASTKIP